MKKEAEKNKTKRKFYFYPKTKLGKISFWLTMFGVALMYIPYWIAIATKSSSAVSLGFLSIALIAIFGLISFLSILKYKDKAILLFLSSFFGLLGILLILGELLIPH